MLGSLLFSLEISALSLSVDIKVRQVPAEIGPGGKGSKKINMDGAEYLILHSGERDEACSELKAHSTQYQKLLFEFMGLECQEVNLREQAYRFLDAARTSMSLVRARRG